MESGEITADDYKFLSTPSARRATVVADGSKAAAMISIHALREEGDSGFCLIEKVPAGISIHALREEGDVEVFTTPNPKDISIHALREEGDICKLSITPSLKSISIHALREEGDLFARPAPAAVKLISIHALREEGDKLRQNPKSVKPYFYPRPPRGGRQRQTLSCSFVDDFYPRPPRGGRRSFSSA